MSARDWFSPGQVWRPRRGRHDPRLTVVNVHRADRLVEVIDASETDRVRAKRTLLRFGELRALACGASRSSPHRTFSPGRESDAFVVNRGGIPKVR